MSTPMKVVTLVVPVAVLLAVEGLRRLRRPSRSSGPLLPPGPTPIPFLGNVWGLNADAPYLTYAEWSKTYGDILYTQILNQEIIVLNSEEVAVELLEKRSNKYSDRPLFALADLFGCEWSSVLAHYGPRLRQHRKLYHQFFSASASLSYRPRQLETAHEMLAHILDDPTHYAEHFDTFAATVVMSVTYGYDINGKEAFAKYLKRAADIFTHFATPESAALCAAFPFIKKLPAWFPFMGFKYEAVKCEKLANGGRHESYAWVRQQVDEHIARRSMVADAIVKYGLDDDSKNPQLVQAIKDSAAALYGAAVETTQSVLLVFVYLLMLHPEVQVRAQAEIDRVVGTERLPDFGDRPALPYVDALLRETLRSHPVVPIGVPHATTEDDIYEGYYIPKGATIMANVWAMSHNEDKYPDPTAFLPERFLQSDGTLNDDDLPWIFGFGRRICPGRHVADASLWCAMVSILAAFTIEKTEGSEEVKWTPGLVRRPLPFPCKFVPRREDTDGQRIASLIYAGRVNS
ncbi:cytochrome P450 [Paxillus ammoniavirescens]|nr:cytochrome P450 [Paxillus ammoniavirescens]